MIRLGTRITGEPLLVRSSTSEFSEVILIFKVVTGTPLGLPRRTWEDHIRMDLEEVGINTKNWVDSAQDRNYWRVLVNAALNLRVP